jgi:hypothetical protein
MTILYALLGWWWLLTAPSWATIYYVDPLGNDANSAVQASTGTPSLAWRHPQKCVNSVAAGDICSLNSGTYTASATYSTRFLINTATGPTGSQALPVTIKSTTRYGAVLRVPSATVNAYHAAVLINRAWYVLDGLDIDGSQTTYIMTAGSTTNHSGVYIEGGGLNFDIKNSKIHHVARSGCSNIEQGQNGIYLEAGLGAGGHIHGNDIYSNGRKGPQDAGCPANATYQDDHGLYLTASTDLTVDHNRFWDNTRGYQIQLYWGGHPEALHTRLVVVFNTFAGHTPRIQGTPNGQFRFLTGLSNVTFTNNIFTDVGLSIIDARTTSYSFSGVSVNRNLTDFVPGELFTGGTVPAGITSSNWLTGQSPLFTNAPARDYTLQGTSPAIDRSVAVSGFPNATYPCTSACDLGAYEYGGSGDSTPPAAPTGVFVSQLER